MNDKPSFAYSIGAAYSEDLPKVCITLPPGVNILALGLPDARNFVNTLVAQIHAIAPPPPATPPPRSEIAKPPQAGTAPAGAAAAGAAGGPQPPAPGGKKKR